MMSALWVLNCHSNVVHIWSILLTKYSEAQDSLKPCKSSAYTKLSTTKVWRIKPFYMLKCSGQKFTLIWSLSYFVFGEVGKHSLYVIAIFYQNKHTFEMKVLDIIKYLGD